MKTLQRESNRLRKRNSTRSSFEALVPAPVTYNDLIEVTGQVITFTPGGVVLVRFIPADQRSNVQV